jgi:myosin-5
MKKQLNEIENERANHQKLIKEHSKLEQRFEKVRNELLKLSKSNYHAANNSSSVTSTTSITTQVNSDLESLIEELEQEKLIEPLHIRLSSSNTSTLSNDTQNNLNNFESNKLLYMTANGSEMDVSLISRLNRRISLLQMGNSINVNNEHDNNNNADGQSEHSLSIERLHQEKDYELIKSQELELENQKLREDLNRLRDLVEENQSMEKDSLINKEMMDQFDALNEEVKRRREECIQLKSLLVNVHRASRPLLENSIDMNGETDLNSVVSNLNYEGNESELRYNSQKILNRVLENQMNDMKKKHEQEKKIIQKEMYKLIEENDRQYGILMNNLTPEKLVEETYKNEIIKLAENNLVSLLLNLFLSIGNLFKKYQKIKSYRDFLII